MNASQISRRLFLFSVAAPFVSLTADSAPKASQTQMSQIADFLVRNIRSGLTVISGASPEQQGALVCELASPLVRQHQHADVFNLRPPPDVKNPQGFGLGLTAYPSNCVQGVHVYDTPETNIDQLSERICSVLDSRRADWTDLVIGNSIDLVSTTWPCVNRYHEVWRVARRLASLGKTNGIPILFFSSIGSEEALTVSEMRVFLPHANLLGMLIPTPALHLLVFEQGKERNPENGISLEKRTDYPAAITTQNTETIWPESPNSLWYGENVQGGVGFV